MFKLPNVKTTILTKSVETVSFAKLEYRKLNWLIIALSIIVLNIVSTCQNEINANIHQVLGESIIPLDIASRKLQKLVLILLPT